MSDAKHTPGELHRRVGRTGDGSPASQHEQLCTEDGVAVCMVEHDGSAEGVANIVRFIACWNACQGISTEALEAGALEGATVALRAATLHLMVRPIARLPETDAGVAAHVRAALAKLEGK